MDEAIAKGSLKPRQQRFIQEYLVRLDPAAAYRAAGYKSKSDAAASSNGRRLLRNDLVSAEIARQQAELAQKFSISAEEVIRELSLIAFSDIGRILDFSGPTLKLRRAEDITEDARRGLASVRVRRRMEGTGDDAREVEVIEFKMSDKLAALRDLGRHLGLFKEPETPAPVNANLQNQGKLDAGTIFRDVEEYLPVFEKIARDRAAAVARERAANSAASERENDTI